MNIEALKQYCASVRDAQAGLIEKENAKEMPSRTLRAIMRGSKSAYQDVLDMIEFLEQEDNA